MPKLVETKELNILEKRLTPALLTISRENVTFRNKEVTIAYKFIKNLLDKYRATIFIKIVIKYINLIITYIEEP